MSRIGRLSLSKHTGPKHTGTVIFFHGSGDNGENVKEWVQLMSKKKPFEFSHLRVLYPTAPIRPYIPMQGYLSTVWFNRYDITPDAPEHKDSLTEIEAEVKRLIEGENDLGIPNERIIVGGFSMGGALSLYTAYSWVPDLAGCFVFSSFLNNDSTVFKNKPLNNAPPLLQLHGDSDTMVNLEWGKSTHENLKALGVSGEFHIIPKLGHSLNPRGVNLINQWILKVLPEHS